jgi:hypothetical protein
VIALSASEKLRGCFISTTGLNLPDVNEVVATFGAFLPDSGHSADFLIFLSDDGYQLLEIMVDGFRCRRLWFLGRFLFDVGAFGACKGNFVVGFFGDESASAVWAKFHVNIRSGLVDSLVEGLNGI